MKAHLRIFLISMLTCCIIGDNAFGLELSVSDEYKKTGPAAPGEMIIEIKRDVVDLGREKGIVPLEKASIKSESLEELNKRYGLISIEKLFSGTRKDEPSDIYVFRFPESVNIDELVSEYENDRAVIYAEPNYIVHIQE